MRRAQEVAWVARHLLDVDMEIADRIGLDSGWPRLRLRPAATGRSRGVADTGEGTSASDAGLWAAGGVVTTSRMERREVLVTTRIDVPRDKLCAAGAPSAVTVVAVMEIETRDETMRLQDQPLRGQSSPSCPSLRWLGSFIDDRNQLRGYRYPPEIIHQAIWLYLRFTLSFRDVEDLFMERGISVSYETVRRWVNHFGPMIAGDLRKRRPKPHTIWYLDEAYLKIAGRMVYRWRAVDAEGEVLEVLVQSKRNKHAALKLMRKLLKKYAFVPERMITDSAAL